MYENINKYSNYVMLVLLSFLIGKSSINSFLNKKNANEIQPNELRKNIIVIILFLFTFSILTCIVLHINSSINNVIRFIKSIITISILFLILGTYDTNDKKIITLNIILIIIICIDLFTKPSQDNKIKHEE